MKQKLLLLLLLLTGVAGQAWAAPLLTADHRLYLPLVRTAEQRDGVTVGYATDATRTLIRWFCVMIVTLPTRSIEVLRTNLSSLLLP